MATNITTSTQAGGAGVVRGGQHALASVGGGTYLALVFGDSGGGGDVHAFTFTSEADIAAAGTAHTGAVTMGRTALLEGGWGLFSTGAFAHSFWTSPSTWTAGTGTAIAGFAAYSGFKGAEGNWHAIAAPAGAGAHLCDLYAATTLGGAWTLLSGTLDLGTALSNSGTDAIIALPNNGAVLVVAVTAAAGTNLVYALTEPLTQTAASGTTWGVAATIGGTHIATQSNNLSGVTDGSGRTWIGLNDGGGVIVYVLPAGGAWSASLQISAASTDASPCLCLGPDGSPWAFWIDNNGAIWGQKLAYSAGPAKGGPVLPAIAAGGVARQRLVAAAGDTAVILLAWQETTTSPYPVVLHVFNVLAAADSGAGTDGALSAFSPVLIDGGQGVEAAGLGVDQSAADTATGADSAGLTATLTARDAAGGTESLATTTPLHEAGTGSEATVLVAALHVADAGTASDTLIGTIPLADAGTGAELAVLAAALGVTETGAGLDGAAIGAQLTVSDAGTGLDAARRAGATSIGGSGAQLVVALRPVGPGGRVYTTFTVDAGDQPATIPLLLLEEDAGLASVDLSGSAVEARLYSVPSFGADHSTPPLFGGRPCTVGADPTAGAVDMPCRAGDFALPGLYELDLTVAQGAARVTSVQSLRITVQAES